MINYIKKFVDGGSIDVDALRKDVKADPRFYDKKNGTFTRSGKERLAAIEEIASVQDQGYKYKIYEDNTFDIVDKSGKLVETTEGRGVEVGKKIGPFYGLINKEKRSKKEVSTILGNLPKVKTVEAKKEEVKSENKEEVKSDKTNINVDPTKRDQNLNITPTATPSNVTTPTNNNVTTKTKDETVKAEEQKEKEKEKVETVITKAKEKVEARDQNLNKDKEIASNIPTDQDTKNEKVENSKEEKSTDKVSENKTEEEKIHETTNAENVLLNAIDGTLTSYEKDDEAETGELNSEKIKVSKKQYLKKYQQLSNKLNKNSLSEAIESDKKDQQILNEYKDYKTTLYGKKIKKLQELIDGLNSETIHYSVREKTLPALTDKKTKLENKRDNYNKNDFTFLKKDLENFVQSIKVPVKHKGGLIPRFKVGGSYVYKHQEANGDKILPDVFKIGNKYFKYIDDQEIETDEFGNELYGIDNRKKINDNINLNKKDSNFDNINQESEDNNLINKYPKRYSPINTENLELKNTGDQQTFKETPEQKAAKERREQRRENISKLGSALKNSPIQLFDIIQAGLVYKNWKAPVAKVEAAQAIYKPVGGRNVRAAKSLDASLIQEAKKNISKITSGYEGSDPTMAFIAKQISNVAKNKALSDLNVKVAEHKYKEEEREAAEQEQNRQQLGQDIINETATINLNTERRKAADLANAQEIQRKDSEFLNNIGLLFQGMQSRFNVNRATNQQFEAGIQAKNIEARSTNLYNDYKLASDNLKDLQFKLNYKSKDQMTPQEKAIYESYETALNDAKTAYDNHNATLETQIKTAKSNIEKIGPGYFNL